jgi:hypothetical protein
MAARIPPAGALNGAHAGDRVPLFLDGTPHVV